jgi:PhzF family phenazine biosynthesis protein
MSLAFVHVDVFTRTPYSGNSLVVFPDARGLAAPQMLRITQEMRHFESIFLEPTDRQNRVSARVFDLFEELPFAGHPVIGAAAVLHRTAGGDVASRNRTIALRNQDVTVATEDSDEGVYGLLDQGAAELLGLVDDRATVAAAWGLSEGDLQSDLPIEVMSTGLRYLIVPAPPRSARQRAPCRHHSPRARVWR